MTAYTLAANATLRDVGTAGIWGVATARTGGDTVDTNGFKLTLDQDSRYGLSGTTSTTWGNLTINASKGGEIHIDGTKVWMIPFTGGSGTLTLGTQITIGGVTCNTIGIYTSLTAAPATTGASGWLKVTNASGIPGTISSGTYAGFTLTANGAAIRGFIEVNGDEAGSIVANRLGTFRVTGAWFDLGTTSGTSNQTLQCPNNGVSRYLAGVYIADTAPRASTYTWSSNVLTVSLTSHGYSVGQQIDITFTSGGATGSYTFTIVSVTDANTFTCAFAGSGTAGNCNVEFFEFWPNAGTTTTTGTDATRGKVVWVDATGLVRIGNSGAATNGHTPSSGRRVVVPNIFFENNTTAARTANVIPNATIATRYDFTATGGGVLEIDKGNFAWYLSATQAYSVNISNSGFIDAILLSEVASPMTFNKVGVGNKPTTALLTNPLTMTLCFAGGTFNDCVWARVSQAASGAHTNVLTDITGFTFNRDTTRANTIRGNNTTYALNGTRINQCTWNSPRIIQGAMFFTTCADILVKDTIYCEAVSGTTVTTYSGSVWAVASNSLRCKFEGLTIPVTNTHPYTQLLAINAAGCSDIKLRNIGTRSAPLTLGSANACGLIYSLATGAAANNVKIQRVYCSNTRTGVMTGDNSSKNVIEENVFGDYADAADVAAVLEYYRKGRGTGLAYTASTAVYGTHWTDHFTSTTVGRLAILMNEPTTNTASQVSLTGGAAFTAAGGLYMPTIGMTATFEMPYYALGHTSFQNSALVMAGGTVGNYQFEYAIDKNDGNGFSALTSSNYTAAQLGTALSGITGIDASKGFKLRIRIRTTTGNTTAITSVYILTNSTAASQDYQYPLDIIKLSLTGLSENSDVVIRATGTETVLASVDQNPTAIWQYQYETPTNVDISIFKPGMMPAFVKNYPLSSSDASIPIVQAVDPSYIE